MNWFSFDTDYHIEREQMCCYLTRTTEVTHQLIRDNLHETPTYGGWVEAKGPRYCPSIEDKVIMFFFLKKKNLIYSLCLNHLFLFSDCKIPR